MIPLDRNESYWMLDEELVEAARAFGAHELSTYPDPQYRELKEAIAKYAGVDSGQIFATPGSASAIEHIARAYAGGGGEVALPVPTFYGYETILGYVGSKILPIAYEERDGRFIFPLEKTIEALTHNSAKILFLCHPNNPLGCPLTSEDMSALVAVARGSNALLVVDEAYFEFSAGSTFLPYLAELPNLIIIRSFSKAFGLSGTRVGYAIASADIVKNLERILLPWSIAHPSVTTTLAFLARVDKVEARREIVITARSNFIKALSTLPSVTVYPSETNFVLIRVPDATRIRDLLLAQGIRVALGESMSRFSDAHAMLKDTLRIVVPAPESEDLFIETLRKALS